MSSNQTSFPSGYKPSRTGDDLMKKSKIKNGFEQLTGLDDSDKEKNKDTQISSRLAIGTNNIADSSGIILGSNKVPNFSLVNSNNSNNNNNNTSNINNYNSDKLNKSNDEDIDKRAELRQLIKQVVKNPKLIYSLFLLYGQNYLGNYVTLDEFETICAPRIMAKVEMNGVGNFSTKPTDEAKVLEYYDECDKANNLDKHGKNDSCKHLPQSAKKFKGHPLFKPRSTTN